MQAIILAAGMGKRLGEYTRNCTKCMVPVAGRPLIQHALDALKEAGIRKLVMVVGYQSSALRELLGNEQSGIEIEYVHNALYEQTNNIFSLFLARDRLLHDDSLLLESDLIFERDLLRQVVEDPRPNLAVVDRYQSWMDGTVVTVDADHENRITSFVAKEDVATGTTEPYFKTVNIYKFSQEFSATTYVPFLEAFSSAMGQNEYYEQVLKVIASVDSSRLQAFDLNGQRWYEIDNSEDKRHAEALFASEDSLSDEEQAMDSAHGGFWRYPDVLDFRYLVNPYFPPPRLVRQMSDALPELLKSYPSGQRDQQRAAAPLFDLREQQLVVGNGASELIRGIAATVSGNVGIVFPTFNEYDECFGDRVVPLLTDARRDFAYDVDELVRLAAQCDNLLLINPDNPTGHCLDRSALLTLAGELEDRNCRLIVDESFSDFSTDGENLSLLDPTVLERFQRLVVIKSLGKSYGVPGARLGVLATSDRELAEDVRSKLPIWNICSFGEYFLQIAGQYQSEYVGACEQLAADRRRMHEQLASIRFLRPLQSEANFICCEVVSQYTATELTRALLRQHQILIKDLSSKRGMQGRSFVRMAVRDQDENHRLVSSLRALDQSVSTDSNRRVAAACALCA